MAFQRQSKTFVFACAFVVALSAVAVPARRAAGQSAQQPAAEPPRTIYVTVQTEDERVIGGLGSEAFGVFDGETKVRMVSFSREDVPTTIGIVLDASGSMSPDRRGNPLATMRGALLSLLLTARSTDEFFLVAFNQQPQLLLRGTSDQAEVLSALDRLATAKTYGQTALYDALYLALDHAANGRHRKRVLVVVTDGHDSVSRFTEGDVKRALREGDVILYVVNFDPHEIRYRIEDAKMLEGLAELSGGKMYRARREEQLDDAMKRITLELRRQYAIGITPAPPTRKDGWHEISIKMAKGRDPQGKFYKLRGRTRKGFYWPPKGS